VIGELGLTEATYYRWKNQYGGLKTDAAKRLNEPEKQNGRPHFSIGPSSPPVPASETRRLVQHARSMQQILEPTRGLSPLWPKCRSDEENLHAEWLMSRFQE
jgi:hypothetical protein